MSTPLNCPFCGKKPKVVASDYEELVQVQCIYGDCMVNPFIDATNRKDAIDGWNLREARIVPNTKAALNEAFTALGIAYGVMAQDNCTSTERDFEVVRLAMQKLRKLL